MENTYGLKCNYFINGRCTNTLIEFNVDESKKSMYFCRTCSYRPQDIQA